MTQNPINTLKVPTFNTKHTTNTKTHFQKSKVFENVLIFCFTKYIYDISIFHTLYLIYLVFYMFPGATTIQKKDAMGNKLWPVPS